MIKWQNKDNQYVLVMNRDGHFQYDRGIIDLSGQNKDYWCIRENPNSSFTWCTIRSHLKGMRQVKRFYKILKKYKSFAEVLADYPEFIDL